MAVRYETEQPVLTPAVSQMSMLPTIDREGITKFINEQGYLTYIVRAVKINSYLKSLMSLAGLLSQFNICITESREAKGQALEKTKADIDKYLRDVEYWNQFEEPEVDHKLHYWKIDNWGEKIFGSHSLEKFVAFENKSKLTNAKKLLKAKNSPVLQMKKNDLLENLKKHSRYKTMFKFEEDHIVISSQKEAAAFIKMLNDDIVRSELTGKEYDSSSKMLLGPVGASH